MKTIYQTYRFVFVLFLLVSFSSCSSDDDGDKAPELTTQELLANKWFLKIIEFPAATPPIVEVADTCQQNTYFNFLATGELLTEVFSVGISSGCMSEGIEALTYSLTIDGSQIIATDGTDATILNLESISESELIVSIPSQRITFER